MNRFVRNIKLAWAYDEFLQAKYLRLGKKMEVYKIFVCYSFFSERKNEKITKTIKK